MTEQHSLTINTGSSSLKAGVYRYANDPVAVVSATIDRIGSSDGRATIRKADGRILLEEASAVPDHRHALAWLIERLRPPGTDGTITAVGHRVVHGGPRYSAPAIVTADMIAELERLVPIDPEHLPQTIECIDEAGKQLPSAIQVACFDTAFHATMPDVAKHLPLPRSVLSDDTRRYGFHGLSCEYVISELRRSDPSVDSERVVIAHLGNGASITAIREGRSIDTTMGMTPTGGLIMGTRSGDLDPGVLLYLLENRDIGPSELSELLNKQAGLKGISGLSSDMRDLLEQEHDNEHAALAVAMFCYQAGKFVGAMAAALGGVDLLVFTGGIGERAASIRERICDPLGFLGIAIDEIRNSEHAAVISTDDSATTVQVIPTNEDLMIARHVGHLTSLY